LRAPHPEGASCVLRTLTRGAVKPRSSVDVDELRQRIPFGNSRLAPSERDPIGVSTLVVPDSSKSMDDENPLCENGSSSVDFSDLRFAPPGQGSCYALNPPTKFGGFVGVPKEPNLESLRSEDRRSSTLSTFGKRPHRGLYPCGALRDSLAKPSYSIFY
jgi:hypothetical protein